MNSNCRGYKYMCTCPHVHNFWGIFLSNPLGHFIPVGIQRTVTGDRSLQTRCSKTPCSTGPLQPNNKSESFPVMEAEPIYVAGTGLSLSCQRLLATSVRSVYIYLLECSQQNLEPNPRLPDLTALTRNLRNTKKVFNCGTAVAGCSMHQCWAASRQQPFSSKCKWL